MIIPWSRESSFCRLHNYYYTLLLFSWHEMGTIDLPNTIDYILDKTGEPDLNYVGHSMGTAIFYVLCSERPDYQDKVRSMSAMAPIAYLNHVKSPIMTFLSSVADPLAVSIPNGVREAIVIIKYAGLS